MSKAKLYQKIAKAKYNFDTILKSADNPFFKSKYANLNSIMDAIIPALTAEGLLLLQPVNGFDVITMIVDIETCESVESRLTIPATIVDPQKMLAAVTYLRRGGVQSLLNLQAEDDDGNSIGEAANKNKTSNFANVALVPAPAVVQHTYKKTLGKTNGALPVSVPVMKETKKPIWDAGDDL